MMKPIDYDAMNIYKIAHAHAFVLMKRKFPEINWKELGGVMWDYVECFIEGYYLDIEAKQEQD